MSTVISTINSPTGPLVRIANPENKPEKRILFNFKELKYL